MENNALKTLTVKNLMTFELIEQCLKNLNESHSARGRVLFRAWERLS